MDYLERIAKEYGPVTVAYVIENHDSDPEQNMAWTVSMYEARDVETLDPETMRPSGRVVEGWHDHEHGSGLQETAKLLWEQLQRERPRKRGK